MQELAAGRLSKMRVQPGDPAQYVLDLGGQEVAVNALLGKRLRICFEGEIRCSYCQRLTKKSFNQGFCYPCFQKLARCDRCIVSPELCHFHEGTCREPEWAQEHCMQDHIVYLANSTGVKVGITRRNQMPTRWLDQGAIQALPIARVSSRRMSGLIETTLGQWVNDKTNWRKLLKHDVVDIDLCRERDQLMQLAREALQQVQEDNPDERVEWLIGEAPQRFEYPSLAWPEKAKTYNLDKQPEIEDTLIAIKGQYLIFEHASLNVRKYGSYQVSLSYL
ncbi:MAG: DUF2797 domain-containing protein [Oleiphilaceae bacterium]|nr:DUF2797 domain-containing protein [Oleiphilaceae bacterium]